MNDNKPDKRIEEVNERLESLKAADKLTSSEALERATNIVTLISKIIDKETGNPAELYEKAKMAYLIAAEKVPKNERDKVAFPSNFWSMRAKQARAEPLKGAKPLLSTKHPSSPNKFRPSVSLSDSRYGGVELPPMRLNLSQYRALTHACALKLEAKKATEDKLSIKKAVKAIPKNRVRTGTAFKQFQGALKTRSYRCRVEPEKNLYKQKIHRFPFKSGLSHKEAEIKAIQ